MFEVPVKDFIPFPLNSFQNICQNWYLNQHDKKTTHANILSKRFLSNYYFFIFAWWLVLFSNSKYMQSMLRKIGSFSFYNHNRNVTFEFHITFDQTQVAYLFNKQTWYLNAELSACVTCWDIRREEWRTI